MNAIIRIDRKAIYQLRAASDACSLSEHCLKSAIKNGDLPASRRGKRDLISGESLHRWLVGQPPKKETASA